VQNSLTEDELGKEEDEEQYGLRPFQSAYLMDDLHVIPEDL